VSASEARLAGSDPLPPVNKRVALLARPGAARERLRLALHEAGAEIVLEDDPNTLDSEALDDAAPQVVLVALEAAIEDSLSRFDATLHDPGIAVIFDEAELAAKREGWEAQRWARHLAAKLYGHADVLPPGGEVDATQPEPGLPRTPAQIHADAGIEPHLEEAQEIALELPRDGLTAGESSTGSRLELESMESEAWQPSANNLRDAPLQHDFAPPPAAPLPPPVPAAAPLAQKPVLELESVQHTTAATHAGVRGAALLFAGIGGPDAVRKVLADLPQDLSRPVLVQLRLDGGRYDNLVKQMARASALPVQLAKAGEAALAGHVYVLPNDVVVQVNAGSVHFVEGELRIETLITALPPAESAVMLLSGSDPAQVDAALALAAQGGLALGQSPQGCYDPAASKALAARGGTVATPPELAQLLVAHWAG
jgi:chemosensory pili system protein ChpB (putative protein-glutamate methylesterase)